VVPSRASSNQPAAKSTFPHSTPASHEVALFFRVSHPSSRPLLAYDLPLRRFDGREAFLLELATCAGYLARRPLMNSGSPTESDQLVAATSTKTRRPRARAAALMGFGPLQHVSIRGVHLNPRPATAPVLFRLQGSSPS
jgi:hypothetical protein